MEILIVSINSQRQIMAVETFQSCLQKTFVWFVQLDLFLLQI